MYRSTANARTICNAELKIVSFVRRPLHSDEKTKKKKRPVRLFMCTAGKSVVWAVYCRWVLQRYERKRLICSAKIVFETRSERNITYLRVLFFILDRNNLRVDCGKCLWDSRRICTFHSAPFVFTAIQDTHLSHKPPKSLNTTWFLNCGPRPLGGHPTLLSGVSNIIQINVKSSKIKC